MFIRKGTLSSLHVILAMYHICWHKCLLMINKEEILLHYINLERVEWSVLRRIWTPFHCIEFCQEWSFEVEKHAQAPLALLLCELLSVNQFKEFKCSVNQLKGSFFRGLPFVALIFWSGLSWKWGHGFEYEPMPIDHWQCQLVVHATTINNNNKDNDNNKNKMITTSSKTRKIISYGSGLMVILGLVSGGLAAQPGFPMSAVPLGLDAQALGTPPPTPKQL